MEYLKNDKGDKMDTKYVDMCIWIGKKIENDDGMLIDKQIKDQDICQLINSFINFAEKNSLLNEKDWTTNINRIRELIGYLVSMAALNDIDIATKFADELNELLPPIKYDDVDKNINLLNLV